jgi:alpha-tubulin suppressor-like RCC1 family protein
MAIIDTTLLTTKVQSAIDALTTSSDTELVTLLSYAAATLATCNLTSSVATVDNLPNLFVTNIPCGQVVFVDSLNVPVLASACEWIGLDGRMLRNDGIISRVWTWGMNSSGQLGDGTVTSRSSPGTTAGGGTNWSSVSIGQQHSAAIKTDGVLWTWGNNACGRLGDSTITARSSPGTIASGTNWSSVSSGLYHTAAIKTDGTLWTWGSNAYGRLGDGTTTYRSSPGTTAGGGTNWSSVSGGQSHTAAVKTDGTLWTWGNNACGRLGDSTITCRSSPGTTAGGGTNWSSVSGGSSHTVGVKTDGTLWTWGWNCRGQLGDGTITARNSPRTTAGGGTNWSSVSGGYSHTAAIKTDGTLWTWGSNAYGRLGDGTTTYRSSPGTTAGGGTNWSSVSGGQSHTAAVKTDGTLWTWGNNACGRLGDSTITARSSPGTTAGGGTNWSSVSSSNFTVAIARCQP